MTSPRDIAEALLAQQTESSCWDRLELGREESSAYLLVKVGGVWQWMTPQEVVEAFKLRELRISKAAADPLRYPWEHDMWRRIDLAMARKRLELPGQVLELLVTGGQRPGKTEGSTRRLVANYLYTKDAWCWGLHETDITSRTIQQVRVERFLPPEMRPEDGKMKASKSVKFKFTAGTGFTGGMFHIKWRVRDEKGVEFDGGGEFNFRFYKQDESTFQGSELTCVASDELIPLSLAKIVAQRLSTRASETARPEFLARIRHAVEILERGETLDGWSYAMGRENRLPLLAAIYHGVHIISFTPAEGWSPTISYFLQGARKYDFEVSPDLAARPEVRDPRVPRFAQPLDPSKLVAYLFTSDNRAKPAYVGLSAKLKTAPENQVRIFLHGDVDKDWQSTYHMWDEARHVKPWSAVPSEGTVYEIIDPAGSKPWVIMHIMCDAAGRHWVLQEWPCKTIPIDGQVPGAWAVVSEGDKRNGDAGPGQRMRLTYTRADYLKLIWDLRARLAKNLRALHGRNLRVDMEKHRLTWGESSVGKEREYVIPAETYMDSRFAGARTEIKGISRTMLEAMLEEENAVPMRAAPGDSLLEGDQFVQQALSAELLGLPGLMVVEECRNTRFTLATYSLPEYRERTAAKDEACKDFRDPIAYYLLSNPEHTGSVQRVSYVNG